MAEGGIINLSFDAKLHRVPFRKFTMEGLAGIPRVHQAFQNVIATSNIVEQDVLYAGLPAVPEVISDLEKTPLATPDIADPVGYRQRNFRLAYKYTRRAARYDKVGVVKGVVSSMGESMAFTIEKVAHEILNAATTKNVGWDKKPLGDDAHKLIGTSQTYDNKGTVGSYPSPAMLQEIYNYFRKVPNDQGWAIPVRISKVICAPELGPAWRQQVSSPVQVGKGDGSNVGGAGVKGDQLQDTAPNPYGHITADMIVEDPYLSDTGATIVVGEGHQMNMFVGEAPRTRTWQENNPEAIIHEISADLTVGVTDSRRVLVFPGA